MNLYQIRPSTLTKRISSPPKKLEFDFGAARNWKEAEELTKVTNNVLHNKEEKEPRIVSPEAVLEVEEKSLAGQIMHFTMPLCSCGDNIHRSFANPTHRFGSVVTNSERTITGQESVVLFNQTRLKMEEQDRSYFEGDFLHNHTLIMLILNVIEDDILPSLKLEVWRVKQYMKRVRVNEKDAEEYEVEVGHPNFYSIRFNSKAEKGKKEARDMMVQSAAGLYLTALQLVNMAQSNKGEDLEE